ncbi:MAG: helix-turn-helix transcriptional regulator [Chlamydiales bacterium]|nr:helix-turn-helix transcriptional regulator [Chlamydiales bacterium]
MSYEIGNKRYSCPLILTLETISGKWKGVILWFLIENPILRFSSLKKKINAATKITDKMLIQCLRELERDGLIERIIYAVVPPKVEYSLTDAGQKLQPIFKELIQFGLNYEKSDV